MKTLNTATKLIIAGITFLLSLRAIAAMLTIGFVFLCSKLACCIGIHDRKYSVFAGNPIAWKGLFG